MTWIAVGERPRMTEIPSARLIWRQIEGSPYTIEEARRLYDDGLAEIANRHEANRVVMVVKLRHHKASFKPMLFRRR